MHLLEKGYIIIEEKGIVKRQELEQYLSENEIEYNLL